MKDRVYVTTSLKASEELRREAAGWAAAAYMFPAAAEA